MFEDNKFKTNLGSWRTLSLFFETNQTDNTPVYTLKPYDHPNGFPSLHLLYMSYDHVPGDEYEFAMECLGGWQHWKRLQTNNILTKHFNIWREEKEVQLRAEAVRKIMENSKSVDATGLSAAKFLVTKGYVPNKVGRMSKEEREALARQDKAVADEVSEDMERLGLKVVK